jgi:DNA-binding HxlR family transcriptional regulator
MADRKLNSTNYINQSFLEDKCELNELLSLVSKRWVCETLFSIEAGHARFTAVKEDLQHISDHILSDRLRQLERYGLIHRNHVDTAPPRVEYTISEKGLELSGLLDQLCHFASSLPDMHANIAAEEKAKGLFQVGSPTAVPALKVDHPSRVLGH